MNGSMGKASLKISNESESQTAVLSASGTHSFRRDITSQFSYLIIGLNGDGTPVENGFIRSSTLREGVTIENMQWRLG